MRSHAHALFTMVASGSALALILVTAPHLHAQGAPAATPSPSVPPAQNTPNAASTQLVPAPAAENASATRPAQRPHRPDEGEPDDAALARPHRTGNLEETPEDGGPHFKDHLRFRAGPLMVEPTALMQVQAIPYVGSDAYLEAADPAERGGFRLRRARFGFQGRLFHRVPFALTAEFNPDMRGTVMLRDAWFGYDRFKFVQVFVGAHNVPFSRLALASSSELSLIERPFAVRAMAPFYQLGVHLEGHFWSNALNYYAGVYNGLQRTDQFFTGYVENSAIGGNRFDGLTYAGRLTSEPLGALGRSIQDLRHSDFRLGLGASALYSDTGTRSMVGLGGDVLLHYKGLHVLGEFIANRSTPKETPTQPTTQTATVSSIGVIGEAGYMILKERLGISARFEWLDPNTAGMDAADSWILAGGLSYHVLHDLLKAQLDYTHREEMHGSSLKNDALVLQAQLSL